MFYQLSDTDIWFPDPKLADADGLLAMGGDLSPERLMLGYHHGIFPWYSDDSPILWYSPHERFVLFPDKLTISRSMLKVIESGRFTFTFDTAFKSVIDACSSIPRKGETGTWINTEMNTAYNTLHALGHAHSVEVWEDNELVGGLYGVSVNNVFCGESMFSKVSNASKAALIWLCHHKKFLMIDCQIYSEHLESLGAGLISRTEYMEYINKK